VAGRPPPASGVTVARLRSPSWSSSPSVTRYSRRCRRDRSGWSGEPLRRGADAARAGVRDIAGLVDARARLDPGRGWQTRALGGGVASGKWLTRVVGRSVDDNDGGKEVRAIRGYRVASQAGTAREAARSIPTARIDPAAAGARASAARATRAPSTVSAGAGARTETTGAAWPATGATAAAGTPAAVARAAAARAASARSATRAATAGAAAVRRPARASDGRVACRRCVRVVDGRERRAPAVVRAKSERKEPDPRRRRGPHGSIF
jgi:hypothetical protein